MEKFTPVDIPGNKVVFCSFPGVVVFLLLFSFQQTTHAQVRAAFSSDITEGCSPVVVQFSDQSAGNPTAWKWDLGNGNSSTLPNPQATYSEPGTYTVTLIVSDAFSSDTLVQQAYITVNANPVVKFSVAPDSGCYPLNVSFTDSSAPGSGSLQSWVWDFGDGNSSTERQPVHTYESAGAFNVSLVVTNSNGCTAGATRAGIIHANEALQPGFDVSDSVACNAPFTVQFTDASKGKDILQYAWDFGDGTTSNEVNPRHTYAAVGTYTVRLAIQNATGCSNTIVRQDLIHIKDFQSDFLLPGGCVNTSLRFVNTSNPQPVSSVWYFSDGQVISGKDVQRAFATVGTYTVKLVNRFAGCEDSVTKTIQIGALPQAAFGADDATGCSNPFTVQFRDSSVNAVRWSWDFGDGDSSSLQHPQHTYTKQGIYTVRLAVSNAAGCTDTLIRRDFINVSQPEVRLTASPPEGCLPLPVSFTADVKSNDNITGYTWDFGDGSGGTGAAVSHTYTGEGYFTVKLAVTTASGCRDSVVVKDAVSAGKKPEADFDASPKLACQSAVVKFTNLSKPPGDQWLWRFPDDGTVSGDQHPSKYFNTLGKQDVELIVSNKGCTDTLLKPDFIEIIPPKAVIGTKRSCSDRYTVTFSDRSEGAVSWNWDFNDGTTSDQQNPGAHRFLKPGSYRVTLTVTNGSCTDKATTLIRIIDEHPVLTVAGSPVCRGNAVTLTLGGISDTALIKRYGWMLGDGKVFPDTGITVFPYTYAQNGTYQPSVTITDLNGCKNTSTVNVTVRGPRASFSVNNPQECPRIPVAFTDLSQNDGVSSIRQWIWDYGDGTADTLSGGPFGHVYASGGAYTVRLVTVDAAGCSDAAVRPNPVIIVPAHADFSVADTLACPGKPLTWINNSQGNQPVFHWDFGDGSTSAEAIPAHIYGTDGLYDVQLSLVTAEGCRDTMTKADYIRVGTPKASFDYSDNQAKCPPFIVKVKNTSVNYRGFEWDFGDGSTSSLEAPTHIYAIPGTYRLRLLIEGYGGCEDSLIKMVTVAGPYGEPHYEYDGGKGCSPAHVRFSANATNTVSYSWDFGDGVVSPVADSDKASHVYTTPGLYIPHLLLEDQNGCRISYQGKDTIVVDAIKDLAALTAYGDPCDSATMQFDRGGTILSEDSLGIPARYDWDFGDSGGNGGGSSEEGPLYHYGRPGDYWAVLQVTSAYGCQVTDSVPVHVPPPLQVRTSGDTTVCQGEPVQLSAGGAARYSWLPGAGLSDTAAAYPVLIADSNITYKVLAYNASDCLVDSGLVSITVHPKPGVKASDDWTAATGSVLRLHADISGEVVSWNWTPSDYLSCTHCPDPVSTPLRPIQYRVTVTNGYGCIATDVLKVNLVCSEGNVFIPNTFTPNGDGMNDIFYPRGRGVRNIIYFRIFNRWGEKVFERTNFRTDDRSAGWNGTFKGQRLLPGVFVYETQMVCDDNKIFLLKGNVTLIR